MCLSKHYSIRCHCLYSKVVHKQLAVCSCSKIHISGLDGASNMLFDAYCRTIVAEFFEAESYAIRKKICFFPISLPWVQSSTMNKHMCYLMPPSLSTQCKGISPDHKWNLRKQLGSIAEFCESRTKKNIWVLFLLEPWKAGKSVASLRSETAPRAWACKRAKVFPCFFSTTKRILENPFLLASPSWLWKPTCPKN